MGTSPSAWRAHPGRVDKLVLAQTGIRHFVGPGAISSLRWLLRLAPTRAVKAFNWRLWKALLVDLGDEQEFWMVLLRDGLDHRLTKTHLLAVMAAMADFTGRHQRLPGQIPPGQPVLVLASEHDRAFAKQADAMRAVYPAATFHTLVGAGHGALFTHTGAYTEQIQGFLARSLTDEANGMRPQAGVDWMDSVQARHPSPQSWRPQGLRRQLLGPRSRTWLTPSE